MNVQQARQVLDDIFVFQSIQIEDLSESVAKDLLRITKDHYYNNTKLGKPLITDAQYDVLEAKLATKFPVLSPSNNVGAAPRGRTHKLPTQMGGLIQVYDSNQLTTWIDPLTTYVISDKLDGNSVLLQYQNHKFVAAYTRGDGVMGKDITKHVSLIDFPKQLDPRFTLPNALVRCEGIIPVTVFEQVIAKSRAYKNARNTVAGAFNTIVPDANLLPLFHLVAYQIVGVSGVDKQTELQTLTDMGFNVVRYKVMCGDAITYQTMSDALLETKNTSVYELDGVVIDVNEASIRSSMRSSSLDPEYARKFKLTTESVESTVTDVEWVVSKDGYLKPTIIIEPVDLLGVTIRRATGHNARNIYNLGICPGARVEVTRQGDVIPGISSVIEPSTEITDYQQWFEQSLDEITDDWTWNDTDVDVVLNDSNNDTVKLRMMIHVLTMLEVDQLREGNVIKLFDRGFTSFEQLIDADTNDFVDAMGVNGTIAYMSLAKKLQNIRIEELMVASGLFGRGIGRKKLRRALEVVDGQFDKLKDIELDKIEGFQEKTANKVTTALGEFAKFYERISGKVTLAPFHNKIEGLLSGQVVVFTGFRDSTLKASLTELGAQVVDTYNKKVTMVIARDPNEGSTKLTKARQNGARVIGLDEVEELIG